MTDVRVPPPWVPLADLPEWIRHMHGEVDARFLSRLIVELRRGPNFRIVGLEPPIIQAGDWEKFLPEFMRPDWEAGVFITGPVDSPASRYPIEARWEMVQRICDREKRRWEAARAPVPPQPALERPRPGGRPPKYNWQRVSAELLRKLSDDGAPAPGDGGQAELERFVASMFPPDARPSDSVIRDKVRTSIEEFRRGLD